MTIKSNGRLGLVLAIGLLAALTVASPAAATAGEATVVGSPSDISRNLSVGQTAADDKADGAIAASQAAQPAVTQPPAEAPAPATTVQAASSDDGGWDTTALIGKVLIGVGTLLTLGSAARMLMA